jgi:hypothetical protein
MVVQESMGCNWDFHTCPGGNLRWPRGSLCHFWQYQSDVGSVKFGGKVWGGLCFGFEVSIGSRLQP